MAIRYLKEVPVGELADKFICCPRPGADVPYGWPAIVTKATRARVTYRRLRRGEWDAAADEWRVVPWSAETSGERLEPEIACVPSQLMLLCDTSEEAISLYVQAIRTERAIRDYRKAALAGVVYAAVDGSLPYAEYLPSPKEK